MILWSTPYTLNLREKYSLCFRWEHKLSTLNLPAEGVVQLNTEIIVRADLIDVCVMHDHRTVIPHWSRVQNHLLSFNHIWLLQETIVKENRKSYIDMSLKVACFSPIKSGCTMWMTFPFDSWCHNYIKKWVYLSFYVVWFRSWCFSLLT